MASTTATPSAMPTMLRAVRIGSCARRRRMKLLKSRTLPFSITRIFDVARAHGLDQSIAKRDDAVGSAGDLRRMSREEQRHSRLPIHRPEQLQDAGAIG